MEDEDDLFVLMGRRINQTLRSGTGNIVVFQITDSTVPERKMDFVILDPSVIAHPEPIDRAKWKPPPMGRRKGKY